MRRTTTPRRSNARRRGGTTLTEVLMSLMVMGVGLVSVATLFPLSVLRSVQATRQTTATSLRYACEAFIDGSYTPPVWSTTPGVYATNPRNGGMTDLVGCPSAAIALDPDGDGDPQTNDTTYDTSLTPPDAFVGTDHREGYYVVDPLGYWRLRQQGVAHNTTATYGARFFGDWSGVGGPPVVGTVTENINRFSLNGLNTSIFGFTGTPASFIAGAGSAEVNDNESRARYLTGLPDSFTTIADGRLSEGTAAAAAAAVPAMVDFSMNGDADFSMFLTSGNPDPVMLARGQVTFIAIDGRRSIVRQLETDLSTTWPAATAGADIAAKRLMLRQPLPANFNDANGDGVVDYDRVIVEAVEDRYTWMFTVRRQPAQSLIDVVTFFNREFGRQDEHIYAVGQNPGSDPFDKEYFVAWNSATEPQPDLRRGGWMFDPINFRWNKIGRAGEPENFTMPGGLAGLLQLPSGYTADRRIVFRLEGAYIPPDTERVLRGVFMKGVVDVYPINPKVAN